MKWTKETARNLISDCKRFRIAKYSTQAGDVYALWAVGKVPALHYGTRKECEAIAEGKANE